MIKDDKIICDECGKRLLFVYVDGYAFGDRLLEGVLFKVQFLSDGWKCIGVEKESEQYMKQLDWNHWKSECEDYCVNEGMAQCPECGDEEVLIEKDWMDK
jgi:hypothetical protein